MKPLKLVVKAFGPYPDEQIFDFRTLRNRMLFLIHGPTGSGKTSVLDAMCFALYGVCSGMHREPKQVRSDHASSDVQTEVQFDFSLGPDVYRVYRKPEQTRPGKGGKTSIVRPEAILHKRTGLESDEIEGTVVATQWKRVTEEIERLVGFRSDQFRQVVMLPQGEFRRLLLADSKEKQAILEVLFRTEFYRRIEEALKQAARDLELQIKDAQTKLGFLLGQADATSADELRERRSALEHRCSEFRQKLKHLKRSEEQTRDQLNEGRAAREKLDELNAARKALQNLELKTEAYDAQKNVLAAAHKAAAVIPQANMLTLRTQESDEANRRLDQARKDLQGAAEQKESASQALAAEEEKAPVVEKYKQRFAQLENLTPQVKQLQTVRQELSRATKEFQQREADLQKTREALEKCKSQMAEILPEQERAEKAAAREEFYSLKIAEIEQAYAIFKKLESLNASENIESKSLHGISDELSQAEAHLAKALVEYDHLEQEWIRGQAALLASSLSEGVPCPVCGSKEHPAPAPLDLKTPDLTRIKRKKAQIDQFRSKVEECHREKTQRELALMQIRSEAEARKEALGSHGNKEPLELQAELKNLKLELKKSQQARKVAALLAEQAENLERSISGCEDTFSKAEVRRTESLSRLQTIQAQCAALKEQLPEHMQEPEKFEREKTSVKKKIAAMEADLNKARNAALHANELFHGFQAGRKAAEDTAAVASSRLLIQREEFHRSLKEAQFPDEKAFLAAKRTSEEIRLMETRIREFEGNLRAAKDRVHRADANAENLAEPDMGTLQKAAQEARKSLEEALREEVKLNEELQRVTRFLSDHSTIGKQLVTLESQYSLTGSISQAANGTNRDRITFQRFVLAALLDDVLAAASKRLKIMSNSRFHLHRVTTQADRRVPGGLDLEVHDTFTGTSRPVYTLSGGESFLASLALALGLADTVQAYAGGIHLDTIFVDEGFGSLDPEALDLALRALMELKQEGRLVGVISHVPELTERIDARLEIIPGKRGSSARFVV
ncbi:AAA family ATPase [Desulfomonile tiedjei]|uniref:ATPase involved in DNA repair n=1 Tax=Desulfomonile tiedjei (strain ATCC 49306 / DSM 6799 / DCB-1) TaxID=706587 RepID=I4C6Q9_DESTA|nr:SMC family ATPase [Desulfomonile tiedjei]AFM25250.1 ATPase involved in DNA repair [Desulfomonile tiedjei DSM 6799]